MTLMSIWGGVFLFFWFFYRQQQSPDTLESSQLEEEVDELSLIDHSEIMSRLTLKQEVGAFRVCFRTLWFMLY